MDLSVAMVAALVVASWRFVRRQRGFATTPLPDVDDAPPEATPIASPRLNDNGLGTYALDLRDTADR